MIHPSKSEIAVLDEPADRATTFTPRVSVVLPTHNRKATLVEAVRSVLDGSFRDLELIVIDDGSTDDSVSLLAEVGDDRLRVIKLPATRGAAAARNVGLEAARGELVAFQDSDDLWGPDHLELLLAVLSEEAHDVAVAFGVAEDLSGRRSTAAAHLPSDGDLRSTLARHNVVALPATLVRREALAAVGGFDPSLPRLQDWDLFLSISAIFRFVFVEDVVLRVGSGGSRISTDSDAYFVALERILKRHAEVFARDPAARVAYAMQIVRRRIQRKDRRSAAWELVKLARYPRGFASWARDRVQGRSPIERPA